MLLPVLFLCSIFNLYDPLARLANLLEVLLNPGKASDFIVGHFRYWNTLLVNIKLTLGFPSWVKEW